MMRLRYLAALLCISAPLAVACSDDGDDEPGAAGAGGEAGAAPGGSGGSAGECGTGTGKVTVEISGLPADVVPKVTIEGPGGMVTAEPDATLEDMPSGSYTVSAARVFDDDPIVRSVFVPQVAMPGFSLCEGDAHTVVVNYEKLPSSNKLWMSTDRDAELAAFDSFAIAESGMTDASVAIDGPGSKAIAFDRDGNLWAFGPTVADPHVVRFPAGKLGESSTLKADRELNVPEVACLPAMRALAFDGAGNLWLSTCGDEIHRLAAADLATSGDKTSDVLITSVTDAAGIAFDAAGNLWIAAGATVVRFDAERLEEPTGDPADLTLTPKDGIGGFAVSNLAFDADGNLWGNDFGANSIFEIAAADLSGTGAKSASVKVSITIGVEALLDQMAFDDGGGLWLGLGQDKDGVGSFGRLTPAQLAVSTGTGDPTTPAVIINSLSIGAGLPVAFFPAASGLPIYHALTE